MTIIDTTFDFHSDTPVGKDPDSHSPTLKKYHKHLWSKELPVGGKFELTDKKSKSYLYHNSHLGEFYLGSDAITHSYRNTKSMHSIIKNLPENTSESLFSVGSTIGSYTLFPSKQISKKMTINASRGCNHKIKDRFDLTLECIRLFYQASSSPLSDVLSRYSDFFSLFEDFKGYVEFFLLQDLVCSDFTSIKFHLPHDNFSTHPLPRNIQEYILYRENTVDFIKKRNKRILLSI